MLDKIIEIVVRNATNMPSDIEVKEDTKLIEDLGYDSIDLVHLINDLDGTFGIKMSDEMMVSEKLNTPRELTELITYIMNK
ncbi:MAG: phosphopantetheine-binding protein [Lachnospiraceae bacterium]|nr:phosphopantetheine-binding protein [Lachnospiraceae bacterium]